MNELELILTDICKCSRTQLYLDSSVVLKEDQLKDIDMILRNRARQIPVCYSLGHTEFMGLELKVNKDVLIPRPETELLVEALIERNTKLETQNTKRKILDIGTGSGCIAIALVKLLKEVDILAVDKSKKALDVALENAKAHHVDKHIRFLQSNLFNHRLFNKDCKFDIIVSNPPYVPTQEIGLFDLTLNEEPRCALDGGLDGCDIFRRINREAGRYLNENGLLILEIGDNQAEKIKDIFSQGWSIEEFRRDYQGIERICILKPKR